MPNWNQLFTSIVRYTNNTYWGNWSLDNNIKPGAVGTILGQSGAFKYINSIDNPRTRDQSQSFRWKLSSQNVSRTEASIDVSGSGTDPESGTKIDAGLKVTWGFNESEGLVSEFSLSRVSCIDDIPQLIQQKKAWLMEQAKLAGMGDGSSVSQGFGFVSSVLYARSGLNVGSSSKGNTFSLSGSVSGVNDLVGASAGGKGSYMETNSKTNVDLHMWPDANDVVAKSEVPIAFTFVSFDGDTALVDWIQPLPSLVLVLKNTHGGTYIVSYDLEYKCHGNTCKRSGSVSGALTQTIGDIPVGATNMILHLKFHGIKSSDEYDIPWNVPHNEWETGICNVDLFGIWPGQTRYEVHFG